MSEGKLHISIKFIRKYVGGKAPCSTVLMLDCDVFPLSRIQQGKLQLKFARFMWKESARVSNACNMVEMEGKFSVCSGGLKQLCGIIYAAGKTPVCSGG